LSRKNRSKKFELILLESIDESFSSLGESAKTSIYLHLERQFKVPREEIPYRLNDFSDALERIFGLGARHLEILIMKNLHTKIDCRYKWAGPKWLRPDLTFKKFVELTKLCYEDIGSIGEIEVIVDAGEKQKIREENRFQGSDRSHS
jgi:hypothetical protein